MLAGLDIVSPEVTRTDDTHRAVPAFEHTFGEHEPAVGADVAESMQATVDVPHGDRLAVDHEAQHLSGVRGGDACAGHPRKYAGNATKSDKAVRVRRDLGRVAELSALEAAYSSARAGRGQTVLLVGEAGVGTSHLIRSFLDAHAGDADLVVAELAGYRGHESMPLAPLIRLSASAAGHASRTVEVAGAALASAVTRRVLTREVVRLADELVQHLSEKETLVLLLDDAQVASSVLVETVAHVARRGRDRHLLTLIATRPDDARIADVLARTDALVLPVDPFDHESSMELVRRVAMDSGGHHLDDESVAAIADRGRGSPRFLIELTVAHSGLATADGAPVPTLRLLVLRRVERLSERALALLRAAALASTPASPRMCALVAGIDPDDDSALEELRREDMIALDHHDGMVRPDPTVHEVVLASTPRDELRRLHGETARLLTVMGADPMAIAPHALEAARTGDRSAHEVVHLAIEAADAAVKSGNPAAALAFAERATELDPEADDEARLRLAVGEAHLHLGHAEHAAHEFERAVALEPNEDAILGLARSLQRCGELEAALDLFDRCSGLKAVRGRAEVLLGLGRVTEARDAAAAAVATARMTGEAAALASALSDQALAEAVANGPTAVKHAAASVRAWRRAGEDSLDWPPLFSLGVALETDDHFDECLDTMSEMRAWLDSRGLLDQVPRCVRTEVTAGFLGCRWARMEEALAAAIDVRRDEPNHEMGPIWAAYAALAAARGDDRGWDRGLARSDEALSSQSTEFDRALAAWWRTLGHSLRLELREAHMFAQEAVRRASALGAANLVTRATPGLAMLSGVLGLDPGLDLLDTFRGAAGGATRPSVAAGELLIRAFTPPAMRPKADIVEATLIYAGTENRLGVILTVACAELVPGHEHVPAGIAAGARDLVSSLGVRGALVESLIVGPASSKGHLA